MKRNKKLKKIIMGGVGFTMAAVVFFTGSMQGMQDVAAKVSVFEKITTTYPSDDSKKLDILEIVPTGVNEQGVNPSAEMGYFIPKQDRQETPTMTSYGTALAAPISSREDATYPNALYNMRTYGLIRPYGADAAGAYPIYALYNDIGGIVFSRYETMFCKHPYKDEKLLEKGVYKLEEGDNSKYKIADGYTIDANGTICKIEKVEIVSENSTLSQNNPTYDKDTNTVIEYVPVTDIDLSILSLPTSSTIEDPASTTTPKEKLKYITYVKEGEKGNVSFTPSERATQMTEYYGYNEERILFYVKDSNHYFYNTSYFREYVLGDRETYKNKVVNYEVKKASDVTETDIQNAELIYISGKAVTFKGNNTDISKEVMMEIFNKEISEHKAVMMDYACYSSDVDNNISKLATLLWREQQSEIINTYAAEGATTLTSGELDKIKYSDLKATMMNGAGGNFVTGNVYVYNHHMSDFDEPKSLVDAGDMFANGDFNSTYTATVMQNSFSPVLNYITATNKNAESGNLMLPSVTPAVAIQYILISDGNPLSVMKKSLNVLEIQPVQDFLYNDERGSEDYEYLRADGKTKANRDAFIENYLGNYYAKRADYITFTSMTVDEFNGRNEDLIETYDVIYIGSNMGDYYNMGELATKPLPVIDTAGELVQQNSETKTLPVYNDTAMNGMVYYNIGDTLKVNTRLKGYLDIDTDEARFGGRDITRDKLKKLKKYLDADKLVLVEGDLMAQTSKGNKVVNPTAGAAAIAGVTENCDNGRIDNASNMYEFMQYGIGYLYNKSKGSYENAITSVDTAGNVNYKVYQNLVSVQDVKNKLVLKADIEQYITAEKLTLTMLDQPRPYSYSLQNGTTVIDPDSVVYMDESANGARQLKYEFMITSELQSTAGTMTYSPSLYVDINNDGKFSPTTEKVSDMQIVKKGNGQEAERNEANEYVLYKDVVYVMTRAIDESFSGYLSWKISIQSDMYPNSHVSAQGNTVVKNKGNADTIKILQITAPSGGRLNLQKQLETEGSLYGKYLDAVPGYEVEVRTMTLTEYEEDFVAAWNEKKGSIPFEKYALEYFASIDIVPESKEGANDGLEGADMIVLGFGDNFPCIQSKDAIDALRLYMESEKPVLMSHDFIMYWAGIDKDGVDRTHSRYLREIAGMDKYGVTQNISSKVIGSQSVPQLINAAANVGVGESYLHSGAAPYTREKNKAIVEAIESTGKAVAYQPGLGRGTILNTTQGISNTTLMWQQGTGSTNTWLNAVGAKSSYFGRGSYDIDRLNEGQITSYPYALPEQFNVYGTHAQHFELDMEADADNDGETDVVVWYTLGECEPWWESDKDYDPYSTETGGGAVPSMGYFIYNKGNITYTGAGDYPMCEEDISVEVIGEEAVKQVGDYYASHPDMFDTQAQLFVNTLFAAYNAAQSKPSVGFFESVPDVDSIPTNSIAVPFDENVATDSSVLKDANGNYRYQFVNPNKNAADIANGTPVYFRLSDSNFVRGDKYMEVQYYIKKDDADFTLDDGKKPTDDKIDTVDGMELVNITDDIVTYNVNADSANLNKFTDEVVSLDDLRSGVVYGFYLPLTYLKDDSQLTIYMKVKTRIETQSSQVADLIVSDYVSGYGISELTVTKTDLLDLD